MKNVLLWSTLWKNTRLTFHERYKVPLPLPDIKKAKNSDCLILNLQCFSHDSMCIHLARNPVITEEWKDLWPKLQDHGWRAVDVKNEKYSIDGLHEATKIVYAHMPEEVDCPQPGVHVFASKIAVVRFVARFPYLLQDDTELVETLLRVGWSRNKKDLRFLWPTSNKRLA